MDYKNAGVDIEAGYKSVELMKEHIKQTMRPEVLTNIGGFFGSIFYGEVQRNGKTDISIWNRWWYGTKSLKLVILFSISMTQWGLTVLQCVSMTSHVRAESRCFS